MLKIVIFCLLFLPTTVFGWQQYVRGGDVKITATPNDPEPNQEVKLELQSYSVDLDHSNISWSKDGKLVSASYGLKAFSFRTGNTNTKTEIITIITPFANSNKEVRVTSIFEPIEVELVWQANNYTPYWYKGKAQSTSEAEIVVSALVRMTNSKGEEIPSDSLVYQWKVDSKNLNSFSGVGKNSITFRGGKRGETNKVSVTVSNADNSLTTSAQTTIQINDPEIVFYEDRPLVGVVWQKALGAEAGIVDRMIIRAEPFFFSDKDKLHFVWNLNGDQTKPDETNPSRIMLQTASKNISSRIGLLLSHPSKLLQEASQNLIIKSVSSASGSF